MTRKTVAPTPDPTKITAMSAGVISWLFGLPYLLMLVGVSLGACAWIHFGGLVLIGLIGGLVDTRDAARERQS